MEEIKVYNKPNCPYPSIEHAGLVKVGKKILKEMGFSKEQIKVEYSFKTPKSKRYLIDLVGISKHWEKPKFWIAIECGNCSKKKREDLKNYFDFVIHLSYGLLPVSIIKTKEQENE